MQDVCINSPVRCGNYASQLYREKALIMPIKRIYNGKDAGTVAFEDLLAGIILVAACLGFWSRHHAMVWSDICRHAIRSRFGASVTADGCQQAFQENIFWHG